MFKEELLTVSKSIHGECLNVAAQTCVPAVAQRHLTLAVQISSKQNGTSCIETDVVVT